MTRKDRRDSCSSYGTSVKELATLCPRSGDREVNVNAQLSFFLFVLFDSV